MNGEVNLQATLSASSATTCSPIIRPHHPITCTSALRLHPDGRLACDHAEVDATDARTHACLDHSLALLLLEIANEVL